MGADTHDPYFFDAECIGAKFTIDKTVNEFFVAGDEYEYCYSDYWGGDGLTDGGAFLSRTKIQELGITLKKITSLQERYEDIKRNEEASPDGGDGML